MKDGKLNHVTARMYPGFSYHRRPSLAAEEEGGPVCQLSWAGGSSRGPASFSSAWGQAQALEDKYLVGGETVQFTQTTISRLVEFLTEAEELGRLLTRSLCKTLLRERKNEKVRSLFCLNID